MVLLLVVVLAVVVVVVVSKLSMQRVRPSTRVVLVVNNSAVAVVAAVEWVEFDFDLDVVPWDDDSVDGIHDTMVSDIKVIGLLLRRSIELPESIANYE